MSYQSVAELKGIARDKMLGNYGTAIGAFLFIRFIIITGMMLASYVAGNNMFINLVIVFALMLLEGIFVYGELAIYLKISVGMKAEAGDIFSAFKGSADKAIRARMVLAIIVYGAFFVGAGMEYVVGLLNIGSASLVMTVGWIVIAAVCIYFLLTYSQIIYYLQDFSDITVLEACRRSRKLMDGNKLTLLGMCISFIPMYIVGVISMMIGLYFVHPYVKMTLTEFYLDRVRQSQPQTNSFDTTV